jgi:hypothetical protein
MSGQGSLRPGRSAQDKLLARRRAERLVIERLLTASAGTASAGAVVRTVLACSRELSDAGVEHALAEVLQSMATARMTSMVRTA